jgi:translation initiation factor IF-3
MLRIIDQYGKPIGVFSKQEALQMARDAELDLVDWGKYNYQKIKLMQKSKRNAKTSELKQMRFGLKISDHDIAVKLKKVNSFLSDGDKVRLVIIYRGREMAHPEIGHSLAEKLLATIGDNITVDQKPMMAGRQLSVVIRSNNAKVKNS